jgi:molybdenum cofactor guanylyltransferase
MLGLVLCGGNSTRMGSDKGLLKLEARTWAQTAVDKFVEIGIPVFLSVNSIQYKSYQTIFSEEQLIKDNEELNFHAPLSGVLSTHIQHPDKDVFVLACDLPLMESSIMKKLLTQYENQPGSGAYVFMNGDEPEPLCAIYTAKGLASILALYHANGLHKYSMKFMLDHLMVHRTVLNEEEKKAFRNFNAHAELNGL